MSKWGDGLEKKAPEAANPGRREGEKPGFSAAGRGETGRETPSYTASASRALDPEFLAANRCISFSLDMPEAEAYRLLRTQVLQRAREKGGNTLMVTSSVPGEGKTLTTINLAFAVAKEFDQTVLLVDCDLRQQKVYRMLGMPSGKGLADYLLDRSPLEDLILRPGVEKMTFISGGQTLEESSELLGSPRMKSLVAELKSRDPDRFVIYDLPPVLSTADALVFAPLVDHVVLVVQAGKTPLPEVKRALEMLPKEKILGIVLNRDEESPKRYYYQYPPGAGRVGDQALKPLPLKEGPLFSERPRKKPGVSWLEEWREKASEIGRPRILGISILSLAVLGGMYYLLAPGPDLAPPGGETLSPKTAIEKIAPVEKKPVPPPPVSSEPPGAAGGPRPAPAAAAPETQAAPAKEGGKPRDARVVERKPPAPKAVVAPQKDFFAIKIMALSDPKRAREFVEGQKKKGFAAHSRPVSIPDKGVMHQIFLGHFKNQEEAQRYLKEKKIREAYPGSVVMKLSR